jgi:hypothetical protein
MMKKIAIALFISVPILLVLAVNFTVPYISDEQILIMGGGEDPYLKHVLFIKRPLVDTVICGNSRGGTISPDPFLERHWSPFNWSISGVNPTHTAMEVAHALVYGKVRRLIVGVSFESMAEKSPLSYARYLWSAPFTDSRISRLWGLRTKANSEPSIPNRLRLVKITIDSFWTTARSHFRYCFKYVLYKYFTHQAFPRALDIYGTLEYPDIRREIKEGVFDFQQNRDPAKYFNTEDGEAAFLKYKQLSPEAKQIYSKMFQELRARKIPTVVFETGRTPAYQDLIDRNSLLKQLNDEWRDFFRKESYGGIKFLEAKDIASCYFFDDFFDAVHFIGGRTEKALSEKLASELEKLEKSARD